MKPVVFLGDARARLRASPNLTTGFGCRRIEAQGIEAECGTMKQKRFDNVWDAIEPSRAQAASIKVRSQMMFAIRETVEAWDVTQAVAAKRLGLTQPRMNDLIRGRISKFSLDALIDIAVRAGLAVRFKVVRPAA